jgi:hypothetical protein
VARSTTARHNLAVALPTDEKSSLLRKLPTLPVVTTGFALSRRSPSTPRPEHWSAQSRSPRRRCSDISSSLSRRRWWKEKGGRRGSALLSNMGGAVGERRESLGEVVGQLESRRRRLWHDMQLWRHGPSTAATCMTWGPHVTARETTWEAGGYGARDSRDDPLTCGLRVSARGDRHAHGPIPRLWVYWTELGCSGLADLPFLFSFSNSCCISKSKIQTHFFKFWLLTF